MQISVELTGLLYYWYATCAVLCRVLQSCTVLPTTLPIAVKLRRTAATCAILRRYAMPKEKLCTEAVREQNSESETCPKILCAYTRNTRPSSRKNMGLFATRTHQPVGAFCIIAGGDLD